MNPCRMQTTCEVRLGRILGLPAVMGARVMGHVERAIPDETGKHLTGFVIRRGLGGAKWADAGTIEVLGDVSLILRSRPERHHREKAYAISAVKDESGLTLGRVTDWWISRDTLDITALEISLGPIEDLRRGRRTIRSWTTQPGDDGLQVLIPRSAWEEVKA